MNNIELDNEAVFTSDMSKEERFNLYNKLKKEINSNAKANFITKGGNDECYTPLNAVKPILKYIPKNAVVWCPFDKDYSNFVKEISKTNKVIYTHIDNGQDFYSYEPSEHWDIIVSNPPFTNKALIFKRALEFNKPFALIMTNTWLNDATPKKIFKDKDFELLMFIERIQFVNEQQESKGKPPFSSSYYCHKFLPKQLIIDDHREY